MTRWVAGAVLVAVVLGATWQGLRRGTTTDGSAGPAAPATPVLSIRRVPVVGADVVAAGRVSANLAAALTSAGAAQLCIDLQAGGTDVFTAQPEASLLPASNIKLLTAFVALLRIGPDAHLTTSVVTGAPPAHGVVAGPLYLVGAGDPLLATAALRPSETDWTESAEPVTSLETLADRIKAAGVTSVGSVVGDDSRFDDQRTVPTWKASYVTSAQVSPVSALEVNSGLAISGHAHRPVDDPPVAAAAALADLLSQRGIKVGSGSAAGRAPAHATSIASVDSPPMSTVIGEMLRESDNLAAEMLTKELGVRFGGAGSWSAGIGVIHGALRSADIPTDGLSQVDGSGLDRSDRTSCRTLVAVLNSPASSAIASDLPIAGACGTLARRFVGTPAAGRIRAKTGSLIGVAALSGYIVPALESLPTCPPTSPAPAPMATFSFLVNGIDSTAAATALEDRIAGALASFPSRPPLDAFAPAP